MKNIQTSFRVAFSLLFIAFLLSIILSIFGIKTDTPKALAILLSLILFIGLPIVLIASKIRVSSRDKKNHSNQTSQSLSSPMSHKDLEIPEHANPLNDHESRSTIPPKEPTPKQNNIDDEAFYELAAIEIENGSKRKGLWTKLWVECNGDDEKTKLEYIKARTAELIHIYNE